VLSVVLLTIAVSLDSLGVGIAYGIKKMYLPATAYIIIAACTTVPVTLSMLTGSLLCTVISSYLARLIGGLILVCLGLWQIHDGWHRYLNSIPVERTPDPLFGLRLPFLGIVVQILRDPERADFDHSHDIDPKEAYALGFALGLDAFAAGFGASMAHFSLYLLPMVTLGCVGFIALGTLIGNAQGFASWQHKGFAVPGMILIIIGLFQFLP